MGDQQATATAEAQGLLEAAQGGDEAAFGRLVDLHRGELNAHCYRMLGSVHDAEDALQDAMLRAWRGLPKFEGRSSVRSWLYRIATNTCLDVIQRRPKRVLPVDYGPAADPHDEGVGGPLVESVWIEPYPDETLGVEDGYASPEARYEQREAVELAFIAALQLLPPNQRAALVLREVLGFSAKETAGILDTTTASVNSALQRARETVEKRVPEKSQQETMRSLGDDGVRAVVGAYVDAWDRGDIDDVVAMLSEDACFSMPPLQSWFRGEDLRGFLEVGPLSGEWRWKNVLVQANGQPALAFYAWNEGARGYLAFALNVLTIRDGKISDVTAFINRSTQSTDPESYRRFPEEPIDRRVFEATFGNFGLPERLE
jgi:RNA polymerase sigma-70 factor (ECF subfamily)